MTRVSSMVRAQALMDGRRFISIGDRSAVFGPQGVNRPEVREALCIAGWQRLPLPDYTGRRAACGWICPFGTPDDLQGLYRRDVEERGMLGYDEEDGLLTPCDEETLAQRLDEMRHPDATARQDAKIAAAVARDGSRFYTRSMLRELLHNPKLFNRFSCWAEGNGWERVFLRPATESSYGDGWLAPGASREDKAALYEADNEENGPGGNSMPWLEPLLHSVAAAGRGVPHFYMREFAWW